MGKNVYCLVSGFIFGLVAVIHLLRMINGWPVQIGSISVPEFASGIAALVAAVLCVWAYRAARQ